MGYTHKVTIKNSSTAAMADSNLKLATIVALTISYNCAKFLHGISHSSRATQFQAHASQYGSSMSYTHEVTFKFP